MIAIVFSKDRPLQLEALIRSMQLNCEGERPTITVALVRASTRRLKRLYESLFGELCQDAGFKPMMQRRFKVSLLRALDGAVEAERRVDGAPEPVVCFLVDDTLFVRRFSFSLAAGVLRARHKALGFSLRLGNNTTYCYSLDRDQKMPVASRVDDNVFAYSWVGADADFGYPLELSSSLFRLGDVGPLLRNLSYENPNELEAVLAASAGGWVESRPDLLCFSPSVAFSVPVNRVQQAYENRAGESPEYTASALADSFARGLRVDVAAYAGFVPRGCHQEVALILKDRGIE